MSKCISCEQDAIYIRHYSGERLCVQCFKKSIEKRVRHTISRFKMFKPEDHIALALSGGKDSISLLHILKNIEKTFPEATLSAILINEGIKNYREEAMDIARENCKKLNIPLHVYSFKEIYDESLDKIAQLAMKMGKLSICSYCGILRRKALNLAAKEVGASKLTLAHNLDDEIQSMMLSILRGDLLALSRVKPVLEFVKGFVQRVKPFCEILEREIALYAYLNGNRFQRISCPYLESSMRSDVRRFLNDQEEKHSGLKYTLYRNFGKIQANLRGFLCRESMSYCRTCGEPSSGKLCRACHSLIELGVTPALHHNNVIKR